MMQNPDFEHDPRTRKATRYFLWLQLAAMISVVGLISLQLHSLALVVLLIALLLSGGLVLWLYGRYQTLPLVREKHALRGQEGHIQEKIAGARQALDRSRQDREHLLRKEQFALEATLLNRQTHYIQKGLSSHSLQDSTIPGLEPGLKQRLAAAGIVTALDVTEEAASRVPGLGAAPHLSLMSWRSMLEVQLDSTKPMTLPDHQLEFIRKKFKRLQAWIDEKEGVAAGNLLQIEGELQSRQQRLEQLEAVTFWGYLRNLFSPWWGKAMDSSTREG